MATAFTEPTHLADYGFNGQVFKLLNCVATFAATGGDCSPAGSNIVAENAFAAPTLSHKSAGNCRV